MGKMLSLSVRWLLGFLCLLGFLGGSSALWIQRGCFCPASASQDGRGLSIYKTVNLRTNNNVEAEKQKRDNSLLADATSPRPRRTYVKGSYLPVNIDEPSVKEIAEFAVSELNKQKHQKSKLVLERVIAGQSQCVAGRNYKLVIAVREDESLPTTPSLNYEVLVFRSLKNFKELRSFHQVN